MIDISDAELAHWQAMCDQPLPDSPQEASETFIKRCLDSVVDFPRLLTAYQEMRRQYDQWESSFKNRDLSCLTGCGRLASSTQGEEAFSRAVDRIVMIEQERDRAIADLEAAHEITGSFWEALKPLHLREINVADPGSHVTALIHERDALKARLKEADRPDIGVEMRGSEES